jgi:hypothetical protein
VRIASPILALDLVDEVTLATVADLEALETEADSQAVVTLGVVSEIVAITAAVSVAQVLVILKVAPPPLLQHQTPLPTSLLLVLREVRLFMFAT